MKLADLPAGTINHHWTKDLTASSDGSKLYATVGSNSNVGENGIEAEKDRAAVPEVDRASGKWRVFASGLRNPNGPSWQPQSGELWVTVNERDELGNDLVLRHVLGESRGCATSTAGERAVVIGERRVLPARLCVAQQIQTTGHRLQFPRRGCAWRWRSARRADVRDSRKPVVVAFLVSGRRLVCQPGFTDGR